MGTPLIVVISGPSGVGKDVLIERMLQLGHGYHFTITATTRPPRPATTQPPRPAEVEGVNHYFVGRDDFFNMVAKGELLEWAQVYGNYYGVPRRQVREALSQGRHVIVRVDVQGARRIREIAPEALFVFVMPPSMEVLRRRLERRGVSSNEDIERRLEAAKREIEEAKGFDYLVVNEEGKLDDTVAAVVQTINAESARVPARVVKI